jgi:hypothetical protein
MNNSTQATTASIIAQEGGLKIGLDNGEIYFNIGNLSAKGVPKTTYSIIEAAHENAQRHRQLSLSMQ